MTVYKVHPSAVRKTHEVGNLSLYYTQGKFLAKQGRKKKKEIGVECLEASLRPMNIAKLSAILNHGYISVNKMNDGSLMLRSHVRGLGAGPLSGSIAYWFTKSLCYGTAAAAAGGAVIASGGLAGAGMGMAITGATMSAAPGAALVAGAIAGTQGGVAIATGVTAGVLSGGSVATTVAMVETASIGIGAFFTAIPFLP
jgi:hypothetical protein